MANVDVKFYGSDNGGTALAEDPYLRYVPAATNSQIQSNDFTNAEWTSTNITPAKDAQGIDGKYTSACTLTSTAANGTAIANSITATSGEHTTCWYIKRSVGTGTVEVTLDNGTTWTGVTLTDSFKKFTLAQSALTNPQIGIRIVTSGDAVIVGNAECYTVKDAAFAHGLPPIFTTTVAVSTTETVYSFASANHLQSNRGYVLEIQPAYADGDVAADGEILSLANGSNLLYYDGVAGDIESADGTNTVATSHVVAQDTTLYAAVAFGTTDLGVATDDAAWVEGTYDGAFTTGTVLSLLRQHGYPASVRAVTGVDGASYSAVKTALDTIRGYVAPGGSASYSVIEKYRKHIGGM